MTILEFINYIYLYIIFRGLSTHVEVFLLNPDGSLWIERLLHARGGVSTNGTVQVGADTGLLHVRGGVSLVSTKNQYTPQSSPRTWRCFS